MDNKNYEMKSLLTADEHVNADRLSIRSHTQPSRHGSSLRLAAASNHKAENNGGTNEQPEEGDTNSASGAGDTDTEFWYHQAASEGDLTHVQKYLLDVIDRYDVVSFTDDAIFVDKRDEYINNYTAHHIAARYNQMEVLDFLLKYGAPVDLKDTEDGNTALLLAIKYNSEDTANLLLKEYNASVHICNKYGQYPLHFAARRGNKDLCETILLLLDSKDGINQQRDKSLGTALHSAVLGTGNQRVVELLIEEGADVEATNKEGEQPLHLASAEDNPEIIVLLAKGAICDLPEAERRHKQICFVNSQTIEKDTALHIAVQAGILENVKTLISIGARVNMRTDTNQTPLHLAAIGGQLEVARYLVMNNAKVGLKDNDQMTPLHKACQFGHVDIVKLLLERGAKFNEKDRRGYTPLMCAVWKGHNDVIEFLLNCRKIDRDELLGINDKDSLSVLHLAVKEDFYDTVEMLLKSVGKKLIDDADAKSSSEDYKSCMHYAAEEGNEGMLVLLLTYGATIDLYDIDDKTPLHRASEKGNLSCVKCLAKEASGIINATDAKGMSALHLAAMNGHYKIVEELIERGAEISSRDEWNWTPLDYAARHGYTITMRMLIENEAKVDAKDTNGTTPLHHATRYGHAYCAQILLDNNANISALNNDQKSCLDLAVENYQRDVCIALINHPRWDEMMEPIPQPTPETMKADNSLPRQRKSSVVGMTGKTQNSLLLTRQRKASGGKPEKPAAVKTIVYQQPMEKLIMFAPEIAANVLDKCIKKEEMELTSGKTEYKTVYDTRYLDLPFKDQNRDNPYFGPSLMVKYHRNNLLQHPVTVRLINAKWAKMGRMLYLSSLLSYLLFITLLTTMVVSRKEFDQDNANKNIATSFCTSHNDRPILPWLVFAATTLQILKELAQAFLLRIKYVKDVVNWFELLLYTSTVAYLIPFVACQVGGGGQANQLYLYNIQWTAGSIAILFAWFNLLLYLKRAPFFGLYVIMFTEVLSTLLMVISVFSILIFGFALAFHALFKLPEELASHEDGNNAFNQVGTGIVRTMVMMIGELEYRTTFTEKLGAEKSKFLPYMEMGYFVFVLFVIIMTIVVMNLLVGLAIGDIESVRNNAYIRMLRSQVYIIGILQRTYLIFPRLPYFQHFNDTLERWYEVTLDDVTDYPAKYNSAWSRLTDWIISLDAESLKKDQRDMSSREQKLLEEIENQQKELDKQKKTIRKIMGTLEKQSEIMKKIVEHVEKVPAENGIRRSESGGDNPKELKRILRSIEKANVNGDEKELTTE